MSANEDVNYVDFLQKLRTDLQLKVSSLGVQQNQENSEMRISSRI